MKFETLEVAGFGSALKGMRNPKNSWDKSDSVDYYEMNADGNDVEYYFDIGENDMKLAQSLILAGDEHSKFMRQIFVSVDITAPRFWFSEFDTYKIGITSNSTSTMHTISKNPITIDCFEVSDEVKTILKHEHQQKRDFIFKCELTNNQEKLSKEFQINNYIYRITNDGHIYACEKYVLDSIGRNRHYPEKELTIGQNTGEYYSLRLGGRNGGLYSVHRLLAEQFIPNPNNLPFVNHIDGNKGNCSLINLEWCTSQENNQHAIDNELRIITPYHRYLSYIRNRKVTLSDIDMMKKMYSTGKSQKEIGLIYGIQQAQVSELLRDNICDNAELYEECFMYETIINQLNEYRELFINSNDWNYVRKMKEILPEGWLQTRTITMSYANLRNMYKHRRNHKLTEWSVDFCKWVETLPYANEFITLDGGDK